MSTNGRLLDRLDLGDIDENDPISARNSVYSTSSIPLPSRAGSQFRPNPTVNLQSHQTTTVPYTPSKQWPTRTPSAPKNFPISHSNTVPNRVPSGHRKYTPMKVQGNVKIPPTTSDPPDESNVTTGQLQKKVVYEQTNHSIVSLKAGLSSPSSDTLVSVPSFKSPSVSSLPESTPEPQVNHTPRIRSNTVGNDSQSSQSSVETASPHLKDQNLPEQSSGEARTKVALQYRSVGKHREASYQLQIAASPPCNYPKAMYLYGMALKFGLGVKQSDRQYLKWICKCVLMYSTMTVMNDIVEQLNNLQPEDLISLIIKKLDFEIKRDPGLTDPFQLFHKFSNLPKSEILKLANASKSKSDILALAYYEVGNALIGGWGLNKKDEVIGLQLLTKSGSMGYIDAMVRLGELYSNKSKNRKKDSYKAAAWLRVSEIFGVKAIGNSWIYKEKYMTPPKT